MLITLVSAIVMVGVSLVTSVPEYHKIQGLSFGTANDEDRRRTRESRGWRDVLASCAMLACILGAYLYFTG